MAHSNRNIASLVGSRICHDLISPIGAVNNGLELLALSGVPDGPEINLVTESATSANARVSLFRLAFGLASEGQGIAAETLCRAWEAAQSGKPVRLIWSGPDSLPRPQAQTVLLGCLCAETALPQGGTVELSQSAGDWRLAISGAPLAHDPALWRCLAGGPAPDGLGPAQVQFLLLPHLLADRGRQARVERTPEQLILLI